MYAKWNDNKYRLINNVELNKSSREVVYSDLIVDFTKKTIDDLPYVQQEIEIYDKEDKLKFTGFVADYSLPELNEISATEKELKISLFSPREMATKRTITIIKTGKMSEIINQILSPLFQDGFTLKEINIDDKVITLSLICRNIEEILNYMSKKYSLYWNIDEMKGIVINSIEYQFNKPAIKKINSKNYKEEILGLITLTPKIENVDYANIINIKNARVFYSKYANVNITLKKNDRLDFENPIDISLETAKRIESNLVEQGVSVGISNLQIIYNDNQEAHIFSNFNIGNNSQEIKDIGKDDSEGKIFTLTTDQTFKNLATGITYKGENSITINQITSQTYLKYANMKLINWAEIDKFVNKITKTGQIEKIIDVKSGWYTVEELIDYIRNIFVANNKNTNQINIISDENNDFAIGEKLEIDLKEYFIKGDYVVTAIKEEISGDYDKKYNIELRNTNLQENYIDLFRNSADLEEQTSQIESEYVVEYSQDEEIKEIHELELNQNMNNTLNFEIRG